MVEPSLVGEVCGSDYWPLMGTIGMCCRDTDTVLSDHPKPDRNTN